MLVTKLARRLIGIASLFVTGVYIEEVCIVLPVKPSWRLPRCSECGRVCPGYDRSHQPVRWVHLGIGARRLILEYAPRRVECPKCGIRVEMVPWARPGSRFTRPFEEMTQVCRPRYVALSYLHLATYICYLHLGRPEGDRGHRCGPGSRL